MDFLKIVKEVIQTYPLEEREPPKVGDLLFTSYIQTRVYRVLEVGEPYKEQMYHEVIITQYPCVVKRIGEVFKKEFFYKPSRKAFNIKFGLASYYNYVHPKRATVINQILTEHE